MGRYIVRHIVRTPDRVSGHDVTIRALSPADATPVAVWDSAEVECRARRRS